MAIRILEAGEGLDLTEDAGLQTATMGLSEAVIGAAFFNQEADPSGSLLPVDGTRWFKPSDGRMYTWVFDSGSPPVGQWVEL